MHSQMIVYETKWDREATVYLIAVDNPTIADVVVNVVKKRTDLKRYRNTWYVTKSRVQSTISVKWIPASFGRRNALRIYLNDPPKQTISNSQRKNYEKHFGT